MAIPQVRAASAAPLSSQERAPRVKITCFALQTPSPLQPLSVEHPTAQGGARGGDGSGCGSGQGMALPLRRKSSSSGCANPMGFPLMEGTLTPSPPADAAGAARQSVHLLGCMGAGWDPSCPSVVSPSSGVTQTSQGWGESALTDHLPAPWPRTGIFQGFFSVPLHTPVPAGSQGLGISRPVSRAAWLHFGNSFGSTLHTSLAARTHLARAPRGLGKRWKKLSKLREGWDFGAANIFKSCCESRQRWFCL